MVAAMELAMGRAVAMPEVLSEAMSAGAWLTLTVEAYPL